MLVFNGINGVTGGFLLPPIAPATLAAIATGIAPEEEWGTGQLDELRYRHDLATQPNFAPISGVDPTKLAQTGWGVIFPAALDANVLAALKEALGELLALRRSHAGDLYRERSGGEGYRAGESKDDFLTRHGSGPGVIDPARFRNYVLLAGDPESILRDARRVRPVRPQRRGRRDRPGDAAPPRGFHRRCSCAPGDESRHVSTAAQCPC